MSAAQVANMRAQIRQHYTQQAITEMANTKAANAALDSFYAAHCYLAARDVDMLLCSQEEIKEALNLVHYYQTRPLFDNAIADLPDNICRLFDITGGQRQELQMRNKQFAARQISECAAFFDGVEKTPLTNEQRLAAVVMEDRNLLIAAAGSGKTSALVGKIGYALHRQLCRPEEVVALAFNKKAAVELRQRINARLANFGGEKVAVETFHALGLRLIGEASGKKPRVAEWAAQMGDNTNNQTDELITELANTDNRFCGLLGQLYSVFRWAIIPRTKFKTQTEYDKYLETIRAKREGQQGIATIKGDMVKSMEECAIANFLHSNGVCYEYEKSYEHDVADAAHSQYHPDFYYPDVGLYHEHFGLNEKGEAPDFMGGDNYVCQTQWKQNLHREKGTKLVISTSAQFDQSGFWDDLQRRLEECGVVFDKPLPPATILGWLQGLESRPIYQLISDFLSLWKASGKSIKELQTKAAQLAGFARARARVFLDAMALLRNFYDGKLRANNEVDFEDMLALAANNINSGAAVHPYKLILADEFQDISRNRAELIKAMLKQKPECKFFAVGDDWQAIYRFAGANIGIMRDFAAEFGTTSESMLTRTFRSNQGIADVASAFVGVNPMQIEKTIRAADSSRTGVIGILHYKDEEDVASFIETKLLDIATRASGCKKVFILGRYGLQYYPQMLTQARLSAWQKQFAGVLTIEFLTMHKAKGLEADYVFILGMHAGKYGFPGDRKDDDLLALVMTDDEHFEFAEERRLFYVALTRAKHKAYLLTQLNNPSPFVDEIKTNYPNGEICNEIITRGKIEYLRQCPECQTGVLLLRQGRYGGFYGCSAWLADNKGCNFTENINAIKNTNRR